MFIMYHQGEQITLVVHSEINKNITGFLPSLEGLRKHWDLLVRKRLVYVWFSNTWLCMLKMEWEFRSFGERLFTFFIYLGILP